MLSVWSIHHYFRLLQYAFKKADNNEILALLLRRFDADTPYCIAKTI